MENRKTVWPEGSDPKRFLPILCGHCNTTQTAEDVLNNKCHKCGKIPNPVAQPPSRYDELPIEDS